MKDAMRVEIIKVDWDLCWGESRSTKPCVFQCKVASAGDGSYLLCATGAAAVVSISNRFLLCSAMSECSCARDSMRLLTLWLQIAL